MLHLGKCSKYLHFGAKFHKTSLPRPQWCWSDPGRLPIRPCYKAKDRATSIFAPRRVQHNTGKSSQDARQDREWHPPPHLNTNPARATGELAGSAAPAHLRVYPFFLCKLPPHGVSSVTWTKSARCSVLKKKNTPWKEMRCNANANGLL